MSAVCASTVSAHLPVADSDLSRADLRPPISRDGRASDHRTARLRLPSRIGDETTTATLASGASENENSQAALRRPESERSFRLVFGSLFDKPDHVAVVEVGDGDQVGFVRQDTVGPVVDVDLLPSTAMELMAAWPPCCQ